MTKVNIIIGRFQPITKGHMKCIEEAYKQGLPTVICMIYTPTEKVDEKHPFSSAMLLPIYESIFKKNAMIKDIILVKNADIVTIGEALKIKNYRIGSWVCGTDRYNSYKKMADKYHDQANLSDDFKLIEIHRTDEDISATKARMALKSNDKREFLKLFVDIPLSVSLQMDIFDMLKTQLLSI